MDRGICQPLEETEHWMKIVDLIKYTQNVDIVISGAPKGPPSPREAARW